jgi:hypothetical protein
MIPLIVGGALAAGSAAASAYDNYQNRKTAREAYNDISDKAGNVMKANQGDIDTLKALYSNTYGGNDVAYNQAVQDFLNSDVYDGQNYSFSGDIKDYVDPAMNQRVDAAMTAIDRQVGGNNLNSDYLARVAGKQSAIASEEWEKAYQRLQNDRRQGLSEWQANENQNVADWDRLMGQKEDAIDLYGQNRDKYMAGMEGATTASLNNRTGNLQTQADVISGKANAMSGQSDVSAALGPISQFLGAYYGAKK